MNLKLSDLLRLSNIELPGEKAHQEMSPGIRENAAKIKKAYSNYKESAVLILLYENAGEFFIPLTERNIYDGTHSGQISFPGGKMEASDSDLKETALRETEEEIGLTKNTQSIITQLSDIYIPPSNFMVTPFVALHGSEPILRPDPAEVAEIIHFPVSSLMNDDIMDTRRIYVKKYRAYLNVPAYIYEEKVIWGQQLSYLPN